MREVVKKDQQVQMQNIIHASKKKKGEIKQKRILKALKKKWGKGSGRDKSFLAGSDNVTNFYYDSLAWNQMMWKTKSIYYLKQHPSQSKAPLWGANKTRSIVLLKSRTKIHAIT